ncbi:HEAT repeat domain-containing protein [Tundrisphaera lichenicola]|uniref:HEAT repeat domain-containing protein n=1 Tax=Tundrisphaera lichenicola TaxID=2029860 RepID=UPI003EBA99B9
MSQAFAPRMPRGLSWVWTVIATIISMIGTVSLAIAQDPGSAKPDEAKSSLEEVVRPSAEIFLDPIAKEALAKIEPINYVGQPIRLGAGGADTSKITAMATGAMAVDPAFLRRYVEFFATELTKRDYINALTNPSGKNQTNVARGLENAVDALKDPMVRARATNQTNFLAAYSRALFDSSLVKILDNNLYSRIDAMIILGDSGSTASNALDLYTEQVKKTDQVVWVKMWAARGLTNAAQQGRVNLDANKTIEATDALIALLDSDPKLPWPVQMRALEALGSLRLAYSKVRKPIDAASVAMRFLSDRDARPEVRAWAAWALGVMRYPPQISPMNFELLGQEIGELAVNLGQRIVNQFDTNADNFDRSKDRAGQLTSLLIFQVFPALSGQEGISDSGILRSTHPGLASAKGFLTQVENNIKEVARESYELIRAGGVAQKTKRDDLEAKVASLKSQISQANPKTRRLIPDGPEFPPHTAQVAGAGGP